MMDRFTLLNLGRLGVNVAKTPLHLKDGELVAAQNCEIDLDENGQALAKRRGIEELTATALADDVLAMVSGALFFPPELDPVTFTPQTLGGGESEFGPAALNVMRAKGYLTAATTSVNNTSETTVSFDAEAFDVGNLHDTTTNPSRFTVPAGGDGLYLVVAQAKFAGDADGIRSTRIFVNGTLVAQNDVAAGTTDAVRFQAVALVPLVATDYVEMKVYHSAGAALNLEGSDENETFLALLRLLSSTTTTLPRCQAVATGNQSISSGAATAAALDGETFDTHTMHDNVTNNSRITVATGQAGLYQVVGHFAWAATLIGSYEVVIRKNGSTELAKVRGIGGNIASQDITGQVTAVDTFVATDYVELVVTQNSGSAHNLLGGGLNTTKLTMARIG